MVPVPSHLSRGRPNYPVARGAGDNLPVLREKPLTPAAVMPKHRPGAARGKSGS
ncbi:MAG: hypothetical protein LBF41_08415 [Deltaproteobacteria bacterium]|nr:hypothetical protein [Deltaproteobacteria bacterium]